jgi:hypothetical protein
MRGCRMYGQDLLGSPVSVRLQHCFGCNNCPRETHSRHTKLACQSEIKYMCTCVRAWPRSEADTEHRGAATWELSNCSAIIKPTEQPTRFKCTSALDQPTGQTRLGSVSGKVHQVDLNKADHVAVASHRTSSLAIKKPVCVPVHCVTRF